MIKPGGLHITWYIIYDGIDNGIGRKKERDSIHFISATSRTITSDYYGHKNLVIKYNSEL